MAKSIVLGVLYGVFSIAAMNNPMELQEGVFFDGRSVILSLAGLFAGDLTTIIACVITSAARFVIGGQGVLTGIGSAIISSLAGITFRRIVNKKAIHLNPGKLFIFGFVVHLILVAWFFSFPIDIAILIIGQVALPYLIVFPLTTMLIGGFMEQQQQQLVTERNLAESEKRFRNLVNALNEGVWETRDDHITTFVNPKMAAMLGYRPEEIIGRSVYDFIPENLHEQLGVYHSRRGEGVSEQYELNLVCKDGKEIAVLVGATPLLDEQGQVHGSLVGIQDVSELKQTQKKLAEQSRTLEARVEERTKALKDAQEQLVKVERMAVLGEMAGSVGHELRNPLSIILNSIYLLKKTTEGTDKKAAEYIALIESEALNASRIINDLLDYSRIQSTPRTEVDFSALLNGLLSKLTIPENIDLVNVLKKKLPPINVNPQQLEQILMNLVTNAIEAMPEGGALRFSSNRRREALSIHIEDTGIGISQSDKKRIFEPLYTTKSRGIGLGLAITSRLAELNDISIRVKSQVGKGTRFTLKFITRNI